MKPRDDIADVIPLPEALKEMTSSYLYCDVQLPITQTSTTLFKRTQQELTNMQANWAATLSLNGGEAEAEWAFQLAAASPIILRTPININDSLGQTITAESLLRFLRLTEHVTVNFSKENVYSQGLLDQLMGVPFNPFSLEEQKCLMTQPKLANWLDSQNIIICRAVENFGYALINLKPDTDCQPYIDQLDNSLQNPNEEKIAYSDIYNANHIVLAVFESLARLLQHTDLARDHTLMNKIKIGSQPISKHLALVSICLERFVDRLQHPRDLRIIREKMSLKWGPYEQLSAELYQEGSGSHFRMRRYITALSQEFYNLRREKENSLSKIKQSIELRLEIESIATPHKKSKKFCAIS